MPGQGVFPNNSGIPGTQEWDFLLSDANAPVYTPHNVLPSEPASTSWDDFFSPIQEGGAIGGTHNNPPPSLDFPDPPSPLLPGN